MPLSFNFIQLIGFQMNQQTSSQALTEDQIEHKVSCAIDRLDRHLLTNQINQDQYDRDIVSIDKWAQQQYDYSKSIGA
jgi:hypothetical protein